MNLRLSALLSIKSDGTQKIANETGKIAQNLDKAQKSANKMSAVGAGGLSRSGGIPHGDGDGLDRRSHAVARGVAGSRGAAGRDFAGLAQLGGETNGLVAAYATLAANIFALTAAFKALSDAAKFVQMQKGLELVGAQSGRTLSVVAQNMEKITGYAISSVEAMKSVASATAAGFSGEEIERLTRVAKGASVALGRDMSDSIDRLTRGTIKLEPELLDELGIMTRIDEAVRGYALQHKLAASALTTTQRRQAFLNAVLAEGETKFGDIADSVDSSAYDKLAASIKKFGTETLSVLNGVLKPFIDALIAVPALGLLPLAGMLSTAFGKLIPDMDKNIARHTARVDLMVESYSKARSTMQGLLDKRDSVIQAATPGEEAWMKQFLKGKGFDPKLALSSDQADIQKRINILKKEEDRINKLLQNDANKNNQLLKNKLDIVKRTLDLQQAELSFQKQGSIFNRRLVKEDVKEFVATRQREVMNRLSDDLYSSGGSLGATLSAYGRAITDQFALARDAAAQGIAVTEEFNKRLDNGKGKLGAMGRAAVGFVSAFKALPGFLDIGLQALQSFLGTIFIIIAAVQVLTAAWHWFEETFLGNTKRVKELKEELKGILEQSKNVNVEIQKFNMAGDFSKSLAAASNSMSEISAKMKEVIITSGKTKLVPFEDQIYGWNQWMKRLEEYRKETGDNSPIVLRSAMSNKSKLLSSGFSEDEAKLATSVAGLASGLSDTMPDEFLETLIKAKKEGKDTTQMIIDFADKVGTLSGKLEDATSAAKDMATTLAKINTPDMFTTNYSPVVASLEQIANAYKDIDRVFASIDNTDPTKKLVSLAQITATSFDNVAELARLTNDTSLFVLYEDILKAQANYDSAKDPLAKLAAVGQKISAQVAWSKKLNIQYASYNSLLENNTMVTLQATINTSKLTDKLNGLRASAMKTGFDIAKITREINLLNKTGSTTLNPLAASIEGIRTAKEAYDLAKKTNAEKATLLDLERQLERIKSKRQISYQETALQGFGSAAIANVDSSLKANKDFKGTNPTEIKIIARKNLIASMKEEYDIQEKIYAQTTANLSQEQKLLALGITLSVATLKAYDNWYNAGKRYQDILLANLAADKESLAIRKQLSDISLDRNKLATSEKAYAAKRNVTPQETRDADRAGLEARLKFAIEENKLALIEHDLKLSNIALERSVLDTQGKLAIEQLASITDPKTMSAEERDALVKTAIRQQNDSLRVLDTSLANAASARDGIVEVGAATEAYLREQLAVLQRSSLADFLNKMQTEQNEAAKAFNRSGGDNNWLAAFSPQAAARSREIAKDPASEGLTAAQIQGLAVQQELFNLQLSATDQILGTIASSFGEMFSGLIDGTVKAKDAFKQFALSVLKMIAQIATEMLILQTLQMILPKGPNIGPGPMGQTLLKGNAATAFSNDLSAASFLSGAAGGIIPMATGGIMDRSMGLQGVITKPTYLVGEGKYNEAVVPLPNGRSIPVQLHSAPNNKNNVQVNVNITDSGTTVDKSGEGMNDLGARIAMAVQKELLAQKAPGGILNKYGVA